MVDKNVLLIGNGLNRCYSDISWCDLLRNIAKNNFVSDETINSMTLAYEQIVNSAAAFTKGNTLTKQTLKELRKLDILKSGYDSLIKEYVKLPINIILTTNFDYAIERTIVPTFSYENNKGNISMHSETYRSTIRHTKIEDKKIFHIHGELGMEKTICLGTVHYMANLTKLIEKLTSESEDDTIVFDQNLLTNEKLKTWAQYFFSKDIYIVGLGLDVSDIDLWWLLLFRANLIREGKVKNRIVYYYTFTEKNQPFLDFLKSLSVNLRECRIENNNWEDTYKRISEDIHNTIEE